MNCNSSIRFTLCIILSIYSPGCLMIHSQISFFDSICLTCCRLVRLQCLISHESWIICYRNLMFCQILEFKINVIEELAQISAFEFQSHINWKNCSDRWEVISNFHLNLFHRNWSMVRQEIEKIIIHSIHLFFLIFISFHLISLYLNLFFHQFVWFLYYFFIRLLIDFYW